MAAIIFDTETTGIKDPEIIEAAWLWLNDLTNTEEIAYCTEFISRYKPNKPISLGALATHHILEEELQNCPPSSSFKLPDVVTYLIGHNIDYDWEVCGRPDVKRICTYALSRKLYPALDSHSQSAMVYYFDRYNAKKRLQNAHSALIDVKNCALILNNLLLKIDVKNWEQLWQISEWARVPDFMPFGKHKGKPITALPKGYRDWLLGLDDLDGYLRTSILQSMKNLK